MSNWWSIAFPRCSFCDVWEFYAFNDPGFALCQKQGSAEYTERATLLTPFYRCFIAWRKRMWFCEGDCIWCVWKKNVCFNTLCEVVSKQASKQANVWVCKFCLSWRKAKKILHFNKTSTAVWRVGGCAHWITTLLLLPSIKNDSHLERGTWFDTFLLK